MGTGGGDLRAGFPLFSCGIGGVVTMFSFLLKFVSSCTEEILPQLNIHIIRIKIVDLAVLFVVMSDHVNLAITI